MPFAQDYMAASAFDDPVTLVSSDGTEFVVSRTVLSVHSSVFEEMFESATDAGQPVKMTETADCLTVLCAMAMESSISARPDVDIEERSIEAALKAAEKYDMISIKKAITLRLLWVYEIDKDRMLQLQD